MKLQSLAILFLSLVYTLTLCGQTISMEGGVGLGSVKKHTEELRFKLDGKAHAFYLNGSIDTKELFPWSRYYNYPILQLETQFLHYNSVELGSSIGIYPTILFPILRKNRLSVYFQLGSGISYHFKTYNRINNPNNNAVSTHVNNLTKLGLQGQLEFANRSALSLNFSLIHSSNGALKTPNRGVNSLMTNLLYKHQIGSVHRKASLDSMRLQSLHQWELSMVTTKRQGEQPNGSDFYFYEGALSYRIATSNVNYLGVGLSVSLSEQDVDFLMRYDKYENRKNARKAAMRYSIFVQDEMMFGDFGLTLSAGVYLFSEYRPFPVYSKLFFRYNMANNWMFSPFIGVELKAHLFTAEYIALKYGLRINGKKRRGVKIKL